MSRFGRGMGFGRTRNQAGAVLAFDPSQLFAGGEGLWLDYTDASTMFQSGTRGSPGTAVSAASDPIGLLLDKSGNQHDFSQGTSANRPLFDTTGGKNSAEYGTAQDKWLSGTLPVATFGGNLDKTIILGVRPSANTGAPCAFHLGQESTDAAWEIEETGGGIGLATYNTSSGYQAAGSQSTVGHTIVVLKSGNDVTIYKNGSIIAGPSTRAGTNNVTNNTAVLGKGIAFGGWKGRIYGCILVPRALNSTEIANADAWMQAKVPIGA